jgi:DNA-binding transcriptional LysR family regulator
VRVDDQRVGVLDALEAGPDRLVEEPGAAVGAVDVQPGAELSRHRGGAGEVGLHVAEPEAALAMLREGEVELAVIEAHSLPGEGGLDDDLRFEHLVTDPFRLVLPRQHRLARRRVIALEELADDAWIDIACEVSCCRAAADTAFRQAGYRPRRSAQAEDYWPAQGFVAAGLGVALIPALALRVLHDGVVVRRLKDAQPVRHVLAATRPALADTAAVRAMIGALKAVRLTPAAEQVQ